MHCCGNLPLACNSLQSQGSQAFLFLCREEDSELGFILRQKPGVENPDAGGSEMGRSFSSTCRKFAFGFSCKVSLFLLSALRGETVQKRLKIALGIG